MGLIVSYHSNVFRVSLEDSDADVKATYDLSLQSIKNDSGTPITTNNYIDTVNAEMVVSIIYQKNVWTP